MNLIKDSNFMIIIAFENLRKMNKRRNCEKKMLSWASLAWILDIKYTKLINLIIDFNFVIIIALRT